MFGKHFAFDFQDAEGSHGPHHFGSHKPGRPWRQFWGGEEGWTPPWLRREGHWSHHFNMRHGHGPFGPGEGDFPPPPDQSGEWQGPGFFLKRRGRGPFGPGGSFGPGGEGPRFFGRGDMKFALLELLQERPMHGYEMIKALEERSGGFYSPSPGSIYPTLQMLEDRGLVSVQDAEGKKVYSITDAGRAFLSEHKKTNEEEFHGPPWMRQRGFGGKWFSPEMQALKSEAMEVMRLLTIAGRMSFQDPAQLAQLRGIIERTRKELTDMIYNTNAQPGQPTSHSSDAPSVEQV